MDIKLVHFSQVLEHQYKDYITEWEALGEKIVPMSSARNGLDFGALQERWAKAEQAQEPTTGKVPATMYFLLEGEVLVGALDFRHELNEYLNRVSGHIGYGVRASKRRMGYAGTMLGMFLKTLDPNTYSKVLVTCNEDNVASALTIESNGGILEDIRDTEIGRMKRYWIQLRKETL